MLVKALEEHVNEALEEAEDMRVALEVKERIARGETTVQDWDEVKKELDALPD